MRRTLLAAVLLVSFSVVGHRAAGDDTVTVSQVRGPFVVVSDRPGGLLQRVGMGGATDSFTLTNVGNEPTTITLTQTGSFFTQTPTQFVLNPRMSEVVRFAGLPQPAGFFEGSSQISGNGVPPGFAVTIRLLSLAAPTGRIDVKPGRARVEVSGGRGENPSGVVGYVNIGDTPAVGIAVSDAPWIRPQTGIITIPPREARLISFTIDRALRADAQALVGSARGKISFRFLAGSGSNARIDVNGGTESTTTASISISIVDVVKPTITPATAPPLAAGEIAKFLSGLVQKTGLSTDVFLSTTTTEPVSDLRIFYSSGLPGAETLLNSIGSLANGSVLSLGGAVSNVFGISGQSGTGQVRSAQAEAISVSAVQGNYESQDGAYITALPVFRSDRSLGDGEVVLLPGAIRTDILRTDVYIQELGGFAGTVRVEVLNEAGEVISSRPADTISAFGQLELDDVAPTGNSTIRITNTGSTGARMAAYAMARDLVTNDGWMIVDSARFFGGSTTERLIVPLTSLSRDSGANTQVFLTNSGSAPAVTSLKLLAPTAPRRRAVRSGTTSGNSREPAVLATQTVTLAPMQTVVIDDALALAGATATGSRYVIVESSGPISASARATMGTGKFNASFGTGIPLFPSTYGLQSGQTHRFSGVDDASQKSVETAVPATFRSSLMLIEASGQKATVRVTLSYSFAASERVVATGVQSSSEFEVAANEITTIDSLARAVIGSERDKYGDLRDMQVDVEVIDGAGRVIPLLESIDNRSGDVILRTE